MVKNSNIPSDGRPDLSEDVLSPDTYGAERVFIEHFVNDDMVEDFPSIWILIPEKIGRKLCLSVLL